MSTWAAKIRIGHPSLGGFGSNTWHFRTTTDGQAAENNAEAAMGAVRQFYLDCGIALPDTAEFHWDGQAIGIMNDEGTVVECDPWTVAGLVAGTALPPFTCINVNWVGSTGDRSKRGRTFLGPITTQALQDNGTVLGNVLTAVRDGAQTLVADSMLEQQWAMGIFSRQENLMRDFIASSVRDQFASLRSRRD